VTFSPRRFDLQHGRARWRFSPRRSLHCHRRRPLPRPCRCARGFSSAVTCAAPRARSGRLASQLQPIANSRALCARFGSIVRANRKAATLILFEFLFHTSNSRSFHCATAASASASCRRCFDCSCLRQQPAALAIALATASVAEVNCVGLQLQLQLRAAAQASAGPAGGGQRIRIRKEQGRGLQQKARCMGS